MTAIVEASCILLAAHLVGLAVLRLLGVTLEDAAERIACSMALGLGLLAYAVLAVGLAGWLTIEGVITAAAALCGASALVLLRRRNPPHGNAASSLQPGQPSEAYAQQTGLAPDAPNQPQALPGPSGPPAHNGQHRLEHPASKLVVGSAITAVGALGVIALIACFVPPGAHEWDALSYHLAAPKVFIRQHRIVYLPTDHHSNFPFTMEMLFTAGLLLNGYPLANLMHFAAGALCILLLWSIARRYFGAMAAALAIVTFGTAPIVVWEAGSAYIELGLALFSIASVAALLRFRERRDTSSLALAAVLAGFALSVKALALIPFAASAIVLVFLRPGLGRWALYAVLALAVGSPFYIKSWIWTGNPVYPFAYRFFGGRDWSEDRAAAYNAEQQSFGQSGNRTTVADDAEGLVAVYRTPTPAQRLRNLLLAPFDLVALPALFYNRNDPGVRTHLGFLWLSLAPLSILAWRRLVRIPPFPILAAICILWFIAWDLSMQYVRYLIPVLGLAAVIGGASAADLALDQRAYSFLSLAAAATQCAFTFLYFVPSLPTQWLIATNAEAREEYLLRSVNCYGAEQWINRHAAKNAGVVLFEDTRGFYLDRPYLWGNSPHSAYIPYERFHSGRDMVRWFLDHSVQYAILNLQFSPNNNSPEARVQLMNAVQDGTTPSLALHWYAPELQKGEKWRALLGDAMRAGVALPIPEACSRATVVLRFIAPEVRG